MTWARVGCSEAWAGAHSDRGPGPAVAAVAGVAGGPGPSGTGWPTAPMNNWTWAAMHFVRGHGAGAAAHRDSLRQAQAAASATPRPPNRSEPAGLACEAARTAVPRHQANQSAPGTPDNRGGPGGSGWHCQAE